MRHLRTPSAQVPVRPVALALAAIVSAALAGLAMVSAVSAEPERRPYPGDPGTVVERDGDGNVPSLRYRGAQRFDTARLIAEDTFAAETTTDVLLARADIFPDALAAGFLAGHLDAPLLLTVSESLTDDTRASLARLDPQRVTLLGETAAISDDVRDELEGEGYVVERTGGADRFATAREIATRADTTVGTRDNDEHSGNAAIVARAEEFPDALVAGMVSYASSFPLLLTTGDQLHADADAALDELDIDTVVIPGGSAAISDAVADEIEDKGITVDRVSGRDRVATSVEFAYFARDQLGFELDHLNMARGDEFPDALTVGPHAGDEGHPIVLSANDTTLGGGGAVDDLLAETCEVSSLHVAGGFAAISEDLEQEMREKAVDTGAVCDIDFDAGDGGEEVVVNPLDDESRTVEGTVVDNAGEPAVDEADVRWHVFRGDFEQTDGVITELDSGVVTTDTDSRFSFEYAGSDEPAWDYVVACTADATIGDAGQAPDTCLEALDVGDISVGDGELLVEDAEPQNVADDLAWSYQIKQWGDEESDAVDDIEFGDGDEFSENPVGTDHSVTVDLSGADADDAEVRFQVFRGDEPGQEDGIFLIEEDEVEPAEDGSATFTYDGPDEPARDYIVACTDPDDGSDPGTCVTGLADTDVQALLVDDEEPQNLRGDVVAATAIKDWVEPEPDVTFDEGDGGDPVLVNPEDAEGHAATVTVTDEDGDPVEGAEVRFEAFRSDDVGDAGEDGQFPSFDEGSQTTDVDGEATFAYDHDQSEARDYVVACTDPADDFSDPGTCLEDGGELVVADGEPQNIDDDLSWSFQTKEFRDAVALQEAQFCDAAELLDDPTDPCEPYENFGDAEGDFLQLTFDDALSPLAEPELDASITIEDSDTGDQTTLSPAEHGLVFLTAAELDEGDVLDDLPFVGDFVSELDDDQLLIVAEEVLEDVDTIVGVIDDLVVDLTGVDDAEGNPVVVDPSREIQEFDPDLLELSE